MSYSLPDRWRIVGILYDSLPETAQFERVHQIFNRLTDRDLGYLLNNVFLLAQRLLPQSAT